MLRAPAFQHRDAALVQLAFAQCREKIPQVLTEQLDLRQSQHRCRACVACPEAAEPIQQYAPGTGRLVSRYHVPLQCTRHGLSIGRSAP